MKKRPEEVSEWLSFADEDLRAAEVLFEESLYNLVCFHAQQSVEKRIKAALLMKEKHLPRIHDLNELFEKCIESNILSLLPFRDKIATLSLYYIPTRYLDAVVGSLPDRLPQKKDAEEALEIAKEMRKILQKREA